MAPLSSTLVWKIPWMEEPGSTKGERICLSILLGFPMNWMTPTCIGKRDLYLNTFTDTLRTSILPIIWAFLSPGRLTHTICYQRDTVTSWCLYSQTGIHLPPVFNDTYIKIFILMAINLFCIRKLGLLKSCSKCALLGVGFYWDPQSSPVQMSYSFNFLNCLKELPQFMFGYSPTVNILSSPIIIIKMK